MPIKQIQLRVPGEIKERILNAARQQDRSMNWIINMIVEQWLDQHKTVPAQPVDYPKVE